MQINEVELSHQEAEVLYAKSRLNSTKFKHQINNISTVSLLDTNLTEKSVLNKLQKNYKQLLDTNQNIEI